jgi:hypothetical protein
VIPTCTITGTFVTASGQPVTNILVRFTPDREQRLPSGQFVSREVSVQSNSQGLVTLTLIRGLRGLLTVTGIAMVRHVEVPDASTANLFDLLGQAPDLFETGLEQVVDLPRRS